MANVLKVFLENGQTKSFKYDSTTTVQVCTFSFLAYTVRPLHDVLKFSKQDVVTSLRDKLCLSADEHFSLVLEHVKSLKRNKLTLLDPKETLARVHCSYFVKRFLKYRTINSTRLLQDPARTSFDVCFVWHLCRYRQPFSLKKIWTLSIISTCSAAMTLRKNVSRRNYKPTWHYVWPPWTYISIHWPTIYRRPS